MDRGHVLAAWIALMLAPLARGDEAFFLHRLDADLRTVGTATWREAGSVSPPVHVSPDGEIVAFVTDAAGRLQPVAASQQNRRPRAAVAIDYLHVNDQHGIVSILGEEFGWFPPYYTEGADHAFLVEFHAAFARNTVQVERAVIHCVPYIGAPFIRIPLNVEPSPPLAPGKLPGASTRLTVARSDNRDLAKLMTLKCPRFLSLKFKARHPWLEAVYDFGVGGWWDFEVDVAMEGSPPKSRFRLTPKVEFPDFKLRRTHFANTYGAQK